MTWQLRRATAADLDAIMSIEEAVFASDAWSRETMLAELEGEHGHYLVAFRPETPEQIDAYAGMRSPRGVREADIQTIAVAPRARRHGLGRVLMRSLIREAWERGAREVFLEVRADNDAARTLYASLGFGELGIRRAYYQPDGVDAVVMRMRIPEPRVTLAEEEEA